LNDFFRDRKALLPHSYACTADQLGSEYALPLTTCKTIQFVSCDAGRWKPWKLLPPGNEPICHMPPDGLFYWALRAWQRVYAQTPVRTEVADGALAQLGTGSDAGDAVGGVQPVVGYVWNAGSGGGHGSGGGGGGGGGV
jgi:hypothetical protein